MAIKQDLILFPCNGNAIEALDCINLELYNVIGFVDDDEKKIGTAVLGIPIFSKQILAQKKGYKIIAVPGSQISFKIKEKIINNLLLKKDQFVTISHNSAKISHYAKIGNNCLIMEGVVIKATATIEDNVCILPNTIIHHDSIVEKNCTIGSQVLVAGRVTIQQNCYIGSGSKIINDVTIGKNSLIGLGAVIIKNVPPNSKMVGNPARNIN